MSEIAYTVKCAFTDEAVGEEWVAWLRGEHLAEVLEAGAEHASIVKLDTDESDGDRGAHYEVRYRFPSREIFNAYEKQHAPRLREKGLERFPLDRGLKYERSTGEIIAERH
ncbi:MAG: DUF4286 family protein [Phycisphaerales bacterium]